VRILQIHPFLRGDKIYARAGGKSRVSLVLSRLLQKDGFEVGIFPWPERIFGGRIAYGVDTGEELSVLPTAGFPAPRKIAKAWIDSSTGAGSHAGFEDRVWRMLMWTGLQNALEDFRPDIVHLHMSHSDFPVIYRALGKRIPLVLTHHTGKYGSHVRDCDFLVCVSKTFQQNFCRETGFPIEKSRVIYNCLSPFVYQLPTLPVAERHGWLFVGGTTIAKGLDLLVEAYRLHSALWQHPLHVYGTGSEEGFFKKIAEKDDLPIVFHGRVNAAELQNPLRSARGVVIPSRSEGFSVALLDALACGTPVIGWAPQVQELEAMWKIPVGMPFDGRTQNADDLAAAMLKTLNNSDDTDEWRSEISRRTRETFSVDAFGEAHRRLYEEIIAS
jgi:glycosyltransferase involved in cell wall biosynthesis